MNNYEVNFQGYRTSYVLGNKTENGVGNAQTFNKSSTTIEFDSPDDSEKAYNYELIASMTCSARFWSISN